MSGRELPSGRGRGRGWGGAQGSGAGAVGGRGRGYQPGQGAQAAGGAGRPDPGQGGSRAPARQSERHAQDAFCMQVMNYLIANRPFEPEGERGAVIQSIEKNILPRTDLSREQRLESHISTILLKAFTGIEFQASIVRGGAKQTIIVSSNQTPVNDKVRAEIETGQDLIDLALKIWQQEKAANRNFKSRIQRHAEKAWHSLKPFSQAAVISVPAKYAPGMHAELRIQAYIEAMNRKTDVAHRLTGASIPSGVKIPCLACYTVFSRKGITLSYFPGSLFINVPSTFLPFEIKIPKTYSPEDVEKVGKLILAKIDPILHDVIATSGTIIRNRPSNLRPDSDSDINDDEFREIQTTVPSKQKKLTKQAPR